MFSDEGRHEQKGKSFGRREFTVKRVSIFFEKLVEEISERVLVTAAHVVHPSVQHGLCDVAIKLTFNEPILKQRKRKFSHDIVFVQILKVQLRRDRILGEDRFQFMVIAHVKSVVIHVQSFLAVARTPITSLRQK